MTKNLLTGENTVVSTATVPAEELKHHAGLKVYDDGRKCVYALNSREVRSAYKHILPQGTTFLKPCSSDMFQMVRWAIPFELKGCHKK